MKTLLSEQESNKVLKILVLRGGNLDARRSPGDSEGTERLGNDIEIAGEQDSTPIIKIKDIKMPIVKKTDLGRGLRLEEDAGRFADQIRSRPDALSDRSDSFESSLSPLERSFQEDSPIAVDDMASAADQGDTLIARIHKGSDFFFQASRIKNIILGKEFDESPLGFQKSLIPIVLLAQTGLVHNDPDSGIGITLYDVRCYVRGMVVNDDELQIAVRLAQDRFDGPGDVIFTVIRGKTDRDKRLPGTRHGLATLSPGLNSFRLSTNPILSEMM
jgi:hypothetical protein